MRGRIQRQWGTINLDGQRGKSDGWMCGCEKKKERRKERQEGIEVEKVPAVWVVNVSVLGVDASCGVRKGWVGQHHFERRGALPSEGSAEEKIGNCSLPTKSTLSSHSTSPFPHFDVFTQTSHTTQCSVMPMDIQSCIHSCHTKRWTSSSMVH